MYTTKHPVDMTEDQLVRDAGEMAYNIREGRYDELEDWYRNLNIGIIRSQAHAYQPLLHAGKDRIVTVNPFPWMQTKGALGLKICRSGDRCCEGKSVF